VSPAGRPGEPIGPPAGTLLPNVALVHDWLTGMRGGERVLEAIAGLYPWAPIYTLFHFRGSVSPALEAHPIFTSFLQRWPGARRHYRRYLPLFPAAIESFNLGLYDLVISSSHAVAKGAIPAPGAFHVCYCHTPMRYAWDQEHDYFPRRRGAAALLRGLALSALRAWDVASAARVDLFVANSRFVARRVERYYGRRAEVVPPPVDVDFFTPGEGGRGAGGGDYCLAVAALSPYKKLDVAIDACARAGIELRIVGEGPERKRLRWQVGRGARLLGRLDRDALRDQLRGARCLVQAGVEDFGIAAVEALACGTPVVALGRGGVLDIVEDGVHGVLCADEREAGAQAAALAAGIDKCARIGWNTRDLRGRAEGFSFKRFIDRFRALLAERVPGRGTSGLGERSV
jgi:glycosyltransferase involved in cell wall biosynthesis